MIVSDESLKHTESRLRQQFGLSLEEAKFRQSLGLNEWDPLPEGVACSCQNTSRNSGV